MVKLSTVEEFVAATAKKTPQSIRVMRLQAIADGADINKNLPANCIKNLVASGIIMRVLVFGYPQYVRGPNWDKWFASSGLFVTAQGVQHIEYIDELDKLLPDLGLEPEKKSAEIIPFPAKPRFRLKIKSKK